MKQDSTSYEFNFIIPTGITGPTGPNNLLESLITSEYENIDIAGTLSVLKSTILPQNSNVFRAESDHIKIDEAGYYEFTLSGCLSESTAINRATLTLRTKVQTSTSSNNLIIVRLNPGSSKMYFSYTKVGRYSVIQNVSLIFSKTSDSDASLEDVKLMIQKLPWTI